MRTAYLTFLLALVLALLASLARQDWRERRAQQRVRATVIGHLTERSPKGIETYAPKLRIDEGPHTGFETTDPMFRSSRTPPEGTQVSVIYPSGEPGRAHLPHPWIRPFSYASLLIFLGTVSALLLRQ